MLDSLNCIHQIKIFIEQFKNILAAHFKADYCLELDKKLKQYATTINGQSELKIISQSSLSLRKIEPIHCRLNLDTNYQTQFTTDAFSLGNLINLLQHYYDFYSHNIGQPKSIIINSNYANFQENYNLFNTRRVT